MYNLIHTLLIDRQISGCFLVVSHMSCRVSQRCEVAKLVVLPLCREAKSLATESHHHATVTPTGQVPCKLKRIPTGLAFVLQEPVPHSFNFSAGLYFWPHSAFVCSWDLVKQETKVCPAGSWMKTLHQRPDAGVTSLCSSAGISRGCSTYRSAGYSG